MKSVKFIKILTSASLLAILAACGGGGGGGEGVVLPSGGGTTAVLSGQVADGYLVGARVFLDRNGNRMLDAGEPWTESEAQGHYSLDVLPGEGDLYPVVVEIIAGQTVDEDQGAQNITESYRLEAPVGQWAFISPLTTLVKHEQDKKPSLSLQEAETSIRAQLALSSSVSLFQDYIQSPDNVALESAHRAARIIAGLMGSLQDEIELNIGSTRSESQRAAIALMISDQIMNNCDTIAQRLATAADTSAIEQIKAEILTAIDPIRLNTELLDRYLQRMQNTSQVWDMTPPKITAQIPAAENTASIAAEIILTFNEQLDQTAINNNSIEVVGPNGPVNGTISYNPTLKQLTFVPEQFLSAFSSYQVTLSGIVDNYGNPIDSGLSWNFTTIFDQLPPTLPVF